MQFSKLFKVKEGKIEILKEWLEVLGTTRKTEAIATFAYENVTREVYVLFEGHDGAYYVLGLNEVVGQIQPGDAKVQINQEHTKIKQECLEPISSPGSILLDLSIE